MIKQQIEKEWKLLPLYSIAYNQLTTMWAFQNDLPTIATHWGIALESIHKELPIL